MLFVFENDKALAIPRLRLIRFSQADAAAKAGEKGGAYSGAVELLSAHLLYGLPPDALHWGARFKSTLIENFNRFMTLNGHRTCLPLESNNISLDPEVKDAWGLPALRVTYIFSEHSWNCSTPLAQERSGLRR